eukprot:scaffold35212_cov69-Phaeocystis_antarctica.AAC.4
MAPSLWAPNSSAVLDAEARPTPGPVAGSSSWTPRRGPSCPKIEPVGERSAKSASRDAFAALAAGSTVRVNAGWTAR